MGGDRGGAGAQRLGGERLQASANGKPGQPERRRFGTELALPNTLTSFKADEWVPAQSAPR